MPPGRPDRRPTCTSGTRRRFRVLEGELSPDVDDRTITLRAGEYAMVPRGAVHRPCNAGPVHQPAGRGGTRVVNEPT